MKRLIYSLGLCVLLAACGGGGGGNGGGNGNGESNQPPVISNLTASPNPVAKGQTMTVTATASDPNGDRLSYTWTVPAGYTIQSGQGTSQIVVLATQFPAEGTIGVTVSDGNLTATRSVAVSTSNQDPVISNLTASPNPVAKGQTMTVTATASDPNGDTLNYTWTVPAGYTIQSGQGTSQIVVLATQFPAEGTIGVTVSDGNLTTTSSVAVSSVAVSTNDGGCTPEVGKLQITNDNAAAVSAQAYDATTIPAVADVDYVFSVLFSTQSTNGTFSCPDGGSYTREINDADNNGSPSAGDVITLTFSICQIADTTTNTRSILNGQLITKLELVTNNSLSQLPLKETFTHNGFLLTASDPKKTTTVVLSGDITAAFAGECPTSECQITQTKAEGADLSATQASTGMSSAVGWRVTNYVTESDLDNNSQESTVSGNGNLYIDRLINAVSFATTAANPFKERKADDYPYAGEEVSTGACNSSVKLTVIDNQNVQIAVDANGDGVYEVTNNMTWSDLEQKR